MAVGFGKQRAAGRRYFSWQPAGSPFRRIGFRHRVNSQVTIGGVLAVVLFLRRELSLAAGVVSTLVILTGNVLAVSCSLNSAARSAS